MKFMTSKLNEKKNLKHKRKKITRFFLIPIKFNFKQTKKAAAAQYNIPRFSDDAMDVITDPEVDAVWICSPSQYHADQIKACAANKKDVFCEKPIATDLAETVEAINACNEAGVKLMIGLQRRFDQNFVRVKQAVQDKEVGDPIMVRF